MCCGTRRARVDGLVETLGIRSLSRSQVSELAKTRNDEVAAFRARPLTPARLRPCGWMRWRVKCHEAGRIVNIAGVVATGVNADSHRGILRGRTC